MTFFKIFSIFTSWKKGVKKPIFCHLFILRGVVIVNKNRTKNQNLWRVFWFDLQSCILLRVSFTFPILTTTIIISTIYIYFILIQGLLLTNTGKLLHWKWHHCNKSSSCQENCLSNKSVRINISYIAPCIVLYPKKKFTYETKLLVILFIKYTKI